MVNAREPRRNVSGSGPKAPLWWAPLAVVAGLSAGCASENDIIEIPSEMSATPALTDLGDVAVGSEVPFGLRLDHEQGPDVTVTGIELGDDSGFFSVNGDFPLVLSAGDVSVVLAGIYRPSAAGWHLAELRITSDAQNDVPNLLMRAHSVPGSAQVVPGVLDFGVVPIGTTATRTLTVRNTGTVDLTIAGGSFDLPGYALTDAGSILVPAATNVALTVDFTAANLDPSIGTLSLQWANDVDISAIDLRANACDVGVPALYDLDADGYTACAGDCDDSNNEIHPGQDEAYDAVDQDCDGVIDEGTIGYDDDGDGFAEVEGDCSDGDPLVSPDGVEVDNYIDDDCDGVVDSNATDRDGDGYAPEGGDCDDDDDAVHPGASEIYDSADQDCDGTVDEGTIGFDDDGDGQSEVAGDCDDTDTTTRTGADELPDWKDNDCDGTVDEGTIRGDDDGDGYTEVGGDCDDGDAEKSPAFGNCP